MSNIKQKEKTIVYVNFSPYENTGKILDYILNRFTNVLVFSLNFHQLGKQQSSRLTVYKSGKVAHVYKLHQIPVPRHLVFVVLPIRSLFIFLQILWHMQRLRPIYKKYDIYFSVNAFTIWIGNFLKKIGVVSKTIFWVWDYYPPINDNKIVMLMRWIYWQFDKLGVYSDKMVFLNDRLQNLRKDIGILPKTSHFSIVPIGTNPQIHKKRNLNRKIRLVFLGVLKKSQGLDLLFEQADPLFRQFSNLSVDIIGSGPDEQYFRHKAKRTKIPIRFHGYIPSEKEMNGILQQSDIGLATYIPQESNVSYYGDPSKIKAYLNFGLPVITTDVFEFEHEIRRHHAGVIIDYFKPDQLTEAVAKILSRYAYYGSGAEKLSKKYFYQKLYQKIFSG